MAGDPETAKAERVRVILETIAQSDSEQTLGSIKVDIPRDGYPSQWLLDAVRSVLNDE